MGISKWNGPEVLKETRKQAADYIEKICLRTVYEAKILTPVKTGLLRSSITYTVDRVNLIGKVGTNVFYAIYVELGTRFMASRSFLRRGLYNVRYLLNRGAP